MNASVAVHDKSASELTPGGRIARGRYRCFDFMIVVLKLSQRSSGVTCIGVAP